jgi:predicted phosphoribosyltransferase
MERGVFEIEAIKQAAAELIGDIEESLVIVDEGKATGSEMAAARERDMASLDNGSEAGDYAI